MGLNSLSKTLKPDKPNCPSVGITKSANQAESSAKTKKEFRLTLNAHLVGVRALSLGSG